MESSFPEEVETTPVLKSTILSNLTYQKTREGLKKKERVIKLGSVIALLSILTWAAYNLSYNFTGAWHGLVEETATIPAETFTPSSTPTELAELEELLSPTTSPDVIGTPLDERPTPSEGGGIGSTQLSKFLQDEELCPNPGRLTKLYGERISPKLIRITIPKEDNPEDIDMLPIQIPPEDRIKDAMGCLVGERMFDESIVFYLEIGPYNMTKVLIKNTTAIEIHLQPHLQLVTSGQPSSTIDLGSQLQGLSAIQDIGTQFKTLPTPTSP